MEIGVREAGGGMEDGPWWWQNDGVVRFEV